MGKTNNSLQRNLFTDTPRPNGSTPNQGEVYRREEATIYFDRAEAVYNKWLPPTCIIADGPYGVSGYPGDEHKADSLVDWYEPHVKAWSGYATPQTTLWFWNTEVGWVTIHPLLVSNGWDYRCCSIR